MPARCSRIFFARCHDEKPPLLTPSASEAQREASASAKYVLRNAQRCMREKRQLRGAVTARCVIAAGVAYAAQDARALRAMAPISTACCCRFYAPAPRRDYLFNDIFAADFHVLSILPETRRPVLLICPSFFAAILMLLKRCLKILLLMLALLTLLLRCCLAVHDDDASACHATPPVAPLFIICLSPVIHICPPPPDATACHATMRGAERNHDSEMMDTARPYCAGHCFAVADFLFVFRFFFFFFFFFSIAFLFAFSFIFASIDYIPCHYYLYMLMLITRFFDAARCRPPSRPTPAIVPLPSADMAPACARYGAGARCAVLARSAGEPTRSAARRHCNAQVKEQRARKERRRVHRRC